MAEEIRVVKDGLRIKIYINSALHIDINPRNTLHFQSWIETNESYPYKVEFYPDSETILCEYQKEAMWKSILKQLD